MVHSPLHVCLDARKIRDGGIGMYIQNAITGLLAHGVRLTLLLNEPPPEYLNLPDSITPLEVKATPFSMGESFLLAREVPWEGIDVFHTPNYHLPFGIPCPSVVTVHDLIHLHHPEKAYYPILSVPLLLSSLTRADRVVSVSRATYEELRSFARYIPGIMKKVRVVSNALSPAFSARKPSPELVRTKFNLDAPYLLSVFSTVKPHKGVKDLLDAFLDLEKRAVLKQHGDLRLVLVGQGTQNLLQVERLLAKADLLRCVRLLGEVTNDELFHLYSSARALIVPSLREGFCLPVIEAHAVRTPVITRPIPAVLDNISPLDHVCEDFSKEGLIRGIEAFLETSLSKPPAESELLSWESDFRKRFNPVTLGMELLKVYRGAIGLKEAGSHETEMFVDPLVEEVKERA